MTSKDELDTLLAPFNFTIFPITSYGVDAKVLIDFAKHIDIVEWQAASVSKKKALLEDFVRASLASIPGKYLNAREKGELEDIALRALYCGRKQ